MIEKLMEILNHGQSVIVRDGAGAVKQQREDACRPGSLDVLPETVSDMNGLLRPDAELLQSKTKDQRIRLGGPVPTGNPQIIEIIAQTEPRQQIDQPGIEIRDHRGLHPGAPQAFQNRYHIIVDDPRGRPAIMLEDIIEESVEPIELPLIEDLANQTPPPFIFRLPQFGFRQAGPEGQRRLLPEQLSELLFEMFRIGGGAMFLSVSSICHADGLDRPEERSGGIEDHQPCSFRSQFQFPETDEMIGNIDGFKLDLASHGEKRCNRTHGIAVWINVRSSVPVRDRTLISKSKLQVLLAIR